MAWHEQWPCSSCYYWICLLCHLWCMGWGHPCHMVFLLKWCWEAVLRFSSQINYPLFIINLGRCCSYLWKVFHVSIQCFAHTRVQTWCFSCVRKNERERSKDRWKGALKYEPETINELWLTLSCKDWKDHTEIRNQAGWFLCCIYLLSFFSFEVN